MGYLSAFQRISDDSVQSAQCLPGQHMHMLTH